LWLTDATKPRWTEKDKLLTLALRAYEDGLCTGCGQPRDKTFGFDAEGWYERHVVTCHGCAAREAERKDDPQPGEKVYVTDSRPSASGGGDGAHDHA